jgi:hypothetical protein
VVRTVLRVVLDHEDQRAAPDRGMRDLIDHLAQPVVVVGDVGVRGPIAGRNTLSVVEREGDVVEGRDRVRRDLVVEPRLEAVEPGDVGGS